MRNFLVSLASTELNSAAFARTIANHEEAVRKVVSICRTSPWRRERLINTLNRYKVMHDRRVK